MNKNTLEKLKERLIEEKQMVEDELSSFAHKDPLLEGDWDTDFPSFGDHRAEQDENADEVEEYENDLPVEYTLETKLQNINDALDKMENGEYGVCEACGKPIEEARLDAEPSAKHHVDCEK